MVFVVERIGIETNQQIAILEREIMKRYATADHDCPFGEVGRKEARPIRRNNEELDSIQLYYACWTEDDQPYVVDF